jgi:hypothetical protein
MKTKIFISIVWLVLCFASFANAAIYIDGQLYSGNILNITDSSYNLPIRLTGNSVVNIYTPAQFNYSIPSPSITLYDTAVVNMFYADGITYEFGSMPFYHIGLKGYIIANNDSVINFCYPTGYKFDIDWDMQEDSSYLYWMETFTGLQITTATYPEFAGDFDLYRYWDYHAGASYTLAPPQIGDFYLRDNAVMNFIPEPATLMLIGTAVPLIRKKRQR